MRKTARQHLKADKQIKKVLLDKNWGGMKAGDMMFVATPKIVDDFIQSIPAGQTSINSGWADNDNS